MEHTKTQWSAEIDEDGAFVYNADGALIFAYHVRDAKTAVHIVRCVNAHDALVDALRNVSYFRNGQRCWCEPGRDSDNHEGQCIAARAALALAEK